MELSIEQLKSIDFFFYYGLGEVLNETKHDIVMGMLQPKRSMLYDRTMGAGISEYENYPSSFAMQVGMKFDIASWISRRNAQVSSGTDGFPDRRVGVSQNTILIQANQGNVDVMAYYIPFSDFKNPQRLSIPAGIGVTK